MKQNDADWSDLLRCGSAVTWRVSQYQHCMLCAPIGDHQIEFMRIQDLLAIDLSNSAIDGITELQNARSLVSLRRRWAELKSAVTGRPPSSTIHDAQP
jgi:hypothetical protein